MIDINDIIFEKYREGKIDSRRMVLLLEEVIQPKITYNGIEVKISKKDLDNIENIKRIKNAIKIINNTSSKKMINEEIGNLEKYSEKYNCPDYKKYMKNDTVEAFVVDDHVIVDIFWNKEARNKSKAFFNQSEFYVEFTIYNNKTIKVSSGLCDD